MTQPKDGKRGLTFERVYEVLSYDPATGIFRWKIKIGDRSPAGKIAGGPAVHGHWRIKIDGHYYMAHRLAWLLMQGEWPKAEIDHKNRVRNDNRWANLRPATHSQNHANTGLRSDNSTGFPGVQANGRGKFLAIAIKDGQRYGAGTHSSPEEAYLAYLAKSRELHGDYHAGVL